MPTVKNEERYMGAGTDREYERLLQTVLAIDNRVLGFVVGILASLGLFVATVWLVVKGGSVVGPHLSLLAQFLPGYSVTYLGSIVGAVYAFALGYAGGWSIAWLYNKVVYFQGR